MLSLALAWFGPNALLLFVVFFGRILGVVTLSFRLLKVFWRFRV